MFYVYSILTFVHDVKYLKVFPLFSSDFHADLKIILVRHKRCLKLICYLLQFSFSYLDLFSPHSQDVRAPTRGHLHCLRLSSISFSAAICGQRMEFVVGRGSVTSPV